MHEAAYRALGIDATYERILVQSTELEGFVAKLATEGFRGVNVTLPHKERVLTLVDEVTPTARAVGAVNTVTVEESGRLEGHNTDAPGLVRSLAEVGVGARGRRVLILGAGGAARAAAVGLGEAGAVRIAVAARRLEAAEALSRDLSPHLSAPLSALRIGDGLDAAFDETDLLVQATSATLGDTDEAYAFADALPFDALPANAVVTDLVYAPRITSVLARAEARGLATVDGLGLLIHQGALSFERWLGRPAPVDAMRRALE
jgi:shikimate dehydrogenase